MNVQKHIAVLRVHLLSMSRLSQRALDYSIKGFELGNSNISRQVHPLTRELNEHRLGIKRTCHELLTRAVTTPSDLRFVLAALRLDSALHATHYAAAQIAHDTTLFLKHNRPMKCPALDRLGEFVNSSMRLCVVALFKKEARHAETVLQCQGVWRRCEMVFDHSRDTADHHMEAQDIYALEIARSLGIVAKQAHEIADAVLFWLKGSDDELALEADGQDALTLLFSGCSTGMAPIPSFSPSPPTPGIAIFHS